MTKTKLFTIGCLQILAGLMAGTVANAEDRRAWNSTLDRISSGIIAIRVDSTRAFDTEWNQSSQATGFVVDAERGLVLTNRHVVTPGPVVAEAVFLNNEEVHLTPVYRDPVHDFGFFRYDPAALKFIKPAELPLYPDGARTGREIRVVGNDAGEKLSILAGTIARLDREAPSYGRGKYNDFNTFYLQAASGTSGGSSGSPVLDIEGRVVALNAGASNAAASSFFLPLDRIERALSIVRSQMPVTRGTLQTVFVVKPYDELRRLGLSEANETRARAQFPDNTGMLTVSQVVAGSNAAGQLVPGDILIGINGKMITEFVPLESILDDSVGKSIDVEVQRGTETLHHSIAVGDLHAITPREYIEFGDAIVHKLSFQQALHYNRPIAGIYVANPGYVFGTSAIPRGALITELNSEATPDLDSFEKSLANIGDGDRVPVRFVTLEDPQNSQLRIVRMDRRWFASRRCLRDDIEGYWPCRQLTANSNAGTDFSGSTRFTPTKDKRAQVLAPSLVLVNFDLPYTVSGVAERHYYGTGLIVDTDRGLVVVDRNTVPVAMGDVQITIAGSLEIPGKVEFIHPLHNIAVVSYDPSMIGDTPVRAARFYQRPLDSGDDVWVVGLRGDHRLVHQKTNVASVDATNLPLSRTLRFRDSNLETISVVNAPNAIDGVLADSRGRVVALWSSFAIHAGGDSTQINRGIPAEMLAEVVETVRERRTIYSLETELRYSPIASARKLGLPDVWADKLEAHNLERRQALTVLRTVAGSPASTILQPGDLLLSVDGQIVNTYRELERATQSNSVRVEVWRGRELLSFDIGTVSLNGKGIDRAIMWAGALLQHPHRAIAAQRGVEPSGVYVAYFAYGSPASRYSLWAGRRIIEVDGKVIDDLDDFLSQVKNKTNQESIRLKTVNWNDAIEVITLKLDTRYWPAYELHRNGGDWQRRDLFVQSSPWDPAERVVKR